MQNAGGEASGWLCSGAEKGGGPAAAKRAVEASRADSPSGRDGHELRVASDFALGHSVREFVRAAVAGTPLSREATADLLLAVTEVFNNAVEHAHRFDASRQVTVRVYRRSHAVEVEVQDEGPGFVPPETKVPSHVLPTQRGLGLFLARQLVDEVAFQRGPGTTVRLVKRFCCSPA